MPIAAVLIKEAQHRIAARAGVAVGAMRPGRVAPVMVGAAEARRPRLARAPAVGKPITKARKERLRIIGEANALAVAERPESGEPSWVRTSDLLIKSQLLYRLS